MISRNRCGYAIRLLAGALILMVASTATSAQYPDKPILVVAPFTAGGDSDLAARNLTAMFPKYTGQNGVVLNKVGASGAIGSEYVKKAVADGYTLLLARVGSQATLPALKPDLAYKWNEFTFLGLLELNPYVCVVRADSPYKTFGDLVEGILNNSDRPPVKNAAGKVIRPGQPLTHFNEVDECAGLDGLFTNRIHTALGQPVENTLHDLRWGAPDASGTTDEYVWVFLISGSAPPAHHIGGYKGTDSLRQPPMYFRLGGGTVRGIAKPGEIVWSRIFVEGGKLKMDLGRAKVITLPLAETERRWKETTMQWPIMHAVTYGVSRDQMMARHKANHIQVAYAHSAKDADLACYAKAALAAELGLEVCVCGTKADGKAF